HVVLNAVASVTDATSCVVLVNILDARNASLEPEYYGDVDAKKYAERKPLIWFWMMFDRFFFFQAEDGIRDWSVTGVQTCALPISHVPRQARRSHPGRLAPQPHPGSARLSLYACRAA